MNRLLRARTGIIRFGIQIACLAVVVLAIFPAAGRSQVRQTLSEEQQAEIKERLMFKPEEGTYVHPHLLTPLSVAGEFPRFTSDELSQSGYPDHLHAFYWPSWTPPVGVDGLTYGPASLCRENKVVPRDGLEVEPGRIRYGNIQLSFNEGYKPCQLMMFVELCDYASERCRNLLGLSRDDTLYVVNPDNTDAYREQSGYGVWRTFALDGDRCIIEPIPILIGRTLIGHSCVQLITRWNLQAAVGDALPPWFLYGVSDYIADMGAHLNNYMAQFRLHGEILLDPRQADAILSSEPLADDGQDRQMFRRASYAAFLMAWHLVENHGGLTALQQFIGGVAYGEEPDVVCRRVYGTDMAGLIEKLNPLVTGEPIGDAIHPRSPHQQPAS